MLNSIKQNFMEFTKREILIALVFLFCFNLQNISAQEDRPAGSQTRPASSLVWLGTYGKIRLADNLYYDLQTHFRTTDFETTAFVGRMIQIYNRHGINYYFTKDFHATVGGVLRLNFSPEPGNENFETTTLEPRIWHQYVIGQNFERFKLIHRFRFEHRFSRSNAITETDYLFRNRWRYKITANIPLNTPDMRPGTFYFSPDVEIIMQSGKQVVDSPLEDLRIQPIIGYIAAPNLKYTMSLMYTTGQSLADGAVYNERWIFRFNVYWNLDFRKFDKKIPDTRFYD